MKSSRKAGFTLIELIIAVAIVGILTAIAYPSYREQVRKSHRTEAKGRLLEVAQLLERRYTRFNAYNVQDDNSAVLDTDAARNAYLLAIASTQNVPTTTTAANRRYLITIETNGTIDFDGNEFTLFATPDNGQLGDRCGNFGLTHTGAKSCTGAGMSAQQCRDRCWN